MLSKPNSSGNTASAASVEDYIQSRVTAAADKGYDSTKIWLKARTKDEGLALIQQAGMTYEVLVREDNGSVQVEVSW